MSFCTSNLEVITELPFLGLKPLLDGLGGLPSGIGLLLTFLNHLDELPRTGEGGGAIP